MNHDELFLETHIRKKKYTSDLDKWVEDQAEIIYVSFQIFCKL